MNVGRYLRGEDRHVGTARITKKEKSEMLKEADMTEDEARRFAREFVRKHFKNGMPTEINGTEEHSLVLTKIDKSNIIEEDYGQFNGCWERTHMIDGVRYSFLCSTNNKRFVYGDSSCMKYVPWKD